MGGHNLLCIFHHTSCLFMLFNLLQMASCHFLHDSALGWFQASLNIWGSSSIGLVLLAIMTSLIRKFKFLLMLFSWAASLTIFWHHCCVFHCTHHFSNDSGFGGHFDFCVKIFVKKFFFNLIITLRVINYIIIVMIIINYSNHFEFLIIIWSLITCCY